MLQEQRRRSAVPEDRHGGARGNVPVEDFRSAQTGGMPVRPQAGSPVAQAQPLPTAPELLSIEPSVQDLIVFFGRLIIFGTCERDCKIAGIEVRSSGRTCFQGVPSGQVKFELAADQANRRNSRVRSERFGLLVDLARMGVFSLDRDVQVVVKDERDRTAAVTRRCRTIGFPAAADPAAIELLGFLGRKGLLPREAIALLGQLDRRPTVKFYVDGVCRTADGVMVEGWLENAAAKTYFLTSADLSTAALAHDLSFRTRRDVTPHLAELGLKILSERHGFIGHLPLLDASSAHVRLFLAEDNVAYHVADLPTKPTRSTDHMLELCWQSISGGDVPGPKALRSLVAPLLRKPKTPVQFNPLPIVEGPESIRVSVIVPFYREWQFVRSIAMMQMWFPADYEWILVCDDPELEGRIRQHLMSRIGLLRNRTILVQNAANYGYPIANNIGAQVARGEHLLFMNSDIWVGDAAPLELAAGALAAERFGAIGFRLCFEDGSVQHDGITFAESPEFNNLFLATHPGKGLPAADEGSGEIVEVEAATAALLMMRRAAFQEMGGFSRKYVGGDFEDADLCLRLKRDGKRIGLVKSAACYHLERQSIRLMGAQSRRMAMTLLNCMTFNELWRDDLVRSSRQAGAGR
jgi:hypothetical protein